MPESTISESSIPPHDLDAERAVLGAALISSDGLAILAERLAPDDFYGARHADIATALVHAHVEGWPADAVSIADRLTREGREVGFDELLALSAGAMFASGAIVYAEIILDRALRRKLLCASRKIAGLARRSFAADKALADAEAILGVIRARESE